MRNVEVIRCMDCENCSITKGKCYPKSKDCGESYELKSFDIYQYREDECDFYKPRKYRYTPCSECYNRYNRQYDSSCDDVCDYAIAVKHVKAYEEAFSVPVKTVGELCSKFCMMSKCDSCPVHIHDADTRTEEDIVLRHALCCAELYKWISKSIMIQEMEIDSDLEEE